MIRKTKTDPLVIKQKTRMRRVNRLEGHLSTDYSKCKGIRQLGIKQCKPVIVDDLPMVETELGCLTMHEVYGECEPSPTPEEIREKLKEVHEKRQMPEDIPKEYAIPVCDTWNVSGPVRRGKESTR